MLTKGVLVATRNPEPNNMSKMFGIKASSHSPWALLEDCMPFPRSIV